ncbi:MAG: hypothetical protein A3D92_08435 [Bacteroidetes bacterium RIFCSPHIGHO2_02_FULL_44_7]|nr:MAG: hypothetical protein A3D92_08435 [Bacteroidetes bacterium RIFCSPHIGHO2_02_FULL_44_7]
MLLPLIGMGTISFAAFIFQRGENRRFLNALYFLLFVATASVFLVILDPAHHVFFWAMVGVVALNFAASHLSVLQKPFIRSLVPLISVVGMAFLLKDRTYDLLGQQGVFINKFLLTGLVLTALGYELARVKVQAIRKFFGGIAEDDTVRAVLLFVTGASLFLCNLEAGGLGLLAFALLPILMDRGATPHANLLDGDVLEGLFFGAFSMFFIQKLWTAEKRSMVLLVLMYGLGLALAMGVLFLSTQFTKMGGMDAFVGVLVGASIVQALIGKDFTGASFIPLLIVGGMILPKFMVNEEEAAFEQDTTVVVDENGKVIEPSVVDLAEIAGTYQILADSSRITFELGEGGETKGAFKKVAGNVSIGEDPGASTFDVTLEMSNFTTFNKIRDESLFGPDYFNAEKNPTMQYTGSKMVSKGENVWELQGEFKMLGVKKLLPILVKRIDIEGRKILIGSGTVDRTQFGMAPSSSEGNVVSFEFKIELK